MIRVERDHMMLHLAKDNLYVTSMSFLRVNVLMMGAIMKLSLAQTRQNDLNALVSPASLSCMNFF